MYQLDKFEVIRRESDKYQNMPIVKINNRVLHLVSYNETHLTSNATNRPILSYEVAGYLEPATRPEDSVYYDYRNQTPEQLQQVRVFIFNTFTRDGFEITNKVGEKEARLSRWSQSDMHPIDVILPNPEESLAYKKELRETLLALASRK